MTQISLFNKTKVDYIDYNNASQLLGVSVDTLRNWVKAKYVFPFIKNKKAGFLKSDIQILKQKIINGEIDRLTSRANKKNSKDTFIPKEYLKNKNDLLKIQKIIAIINENKIDTELALLLLSLNSLEKKGLIKNNLNTCSSFEQISFKNEFVKKVILNWASKFLNIELNKYKIIINTSIVETNDFLGIIYQSLLKEGNKAQGGSYYSPSKVVDLIVNQYHDKITNKTRVLDPCCGTGQFLLSFSKLVLNPNNLWGYDIDEIAVHIARVNLLLAYPNVNFFPNIYCQDTLISNLPTKYDIIATNPPWGYHFSDNELIRLKLLFPKITSSEAFSYFILKGLNLLSTNGYLSYVLPESILKVKQHSDVRKYILESTSILSISHLGNVFTKVVSPVIVLNLKKTVTNTQNVIIINKSGNKYNVNQSRFAANKNFLFDTTISEKDDQIIKKIYRKKHITLENNADWALGIVTGNNKAFISNVKLANYERVLKGSDIKQYYYKEPTAFILFKPKKFQQTAAETKYRAEEKLVYKFISDTLTFAYDNKKTLTLNSANILIPKINDYPTKLIMALFNSILYQYLFKKKFNTIKILKGDLEQLPLPKLSKTVESKILKKVGLLIKQGIEENYRRNLIAEINDMIFKIYKLNRSEIEYIKKSLD